MWKWILKQAIVALAEPIFDAIIQALEDLAKRTNNTVDDAFVAKFKEFKDAIVNWIISHSNSISKAA
ncbi:MAG: hypothetical protein KAH01_07525 [Caldisericia bacterium]|nr:hypothetical protein [Caldisericia bacterium]